MTDGKAEYFRKPKTEQMVAIANNIYFAKNIWRCDMADKQIVEEIYKRLKMFMIESNWLDGNTPGQARALFTTLCFMGILGRI